VVTTYKINTKQKGKSKNCWIRIFSHKNSIYGKSQFCWHPTHFVKMGHISPGNTVDPVFDHVLHMFPDLDPW